PNSIVINGARNTVLRQTAFARFLFIIYECIFIEFQIIGNIYEIDAKQVFIAYLINPPKRSVIKIKSFIGIYNISNIVLNFGILGNSVEKFIIGGGFKKIAQT